VGPDASRLGFVNLNSYSVTSLWDIGIQDSRLLVPKRYFNALDYPFTLDVLKGDEPFATFKSGETPYADFSLVHEGATYLWKSLGGTKELQIDGTTLAKAYSKGLFVNQTYIEVRQDLPLELIAVLFPMFCGVFRTRSA
jgi:hypothetical protein